VSDKKIVIGEFASFRERLPGILKALAVGIPAGYVFDLLDTPIPWMIGPMIAVANLNLIGLRMHSPVCPSFGSGNSRFSSVALLYANCYRCTCGELPGDRCRDNSSFLDRRARRIDPEPGFRC
jgi:hypothetical protein